MINNFAKMKTIEFYYRRDGKIQKENHFIYKKNGVSLETFIFEEVSNNLFRQLNEDNKVVSIVEYNDRNDVIKKIIDTNIVYDVKMEYCKYGISKMIKNNNSPTQYFYNDNGELLYLILPDGRKINVGKFGNQYIYVDEKGSIYKIEEYDSKGNLISEIHDKYYIKREYNKKGLVIKLDIFSNILNS